MVFVSSSNLDNKDYFAMGIILIILGLLLIGKGCYDENKKINREIKTGKKSNHTNLSIYLPIGFLISAIGVSIS